jgi:hypothetical protein
LVKILLFPEDARLQYNPSMLRKTAAALVCITWALWFGGLAALFLFVTRLFAVDRDLAKQAAPQLFGVFEKYQILLAAVALLSAAVWRMISGSIRATALFWLLGIASVAAALGPVLITGKMNALISRNQSDTPEFRKLHGQSMMIYSGETLVLLAAGIMLPWALQGPGQSPAPDGKK